MAKGLSGLVIHREQLDQTVGATLADLKPPQPFVPGGTLKSSFTIGNAKEVFMYTYELGAASNPGNRQYDIVNAHKAHLFGKIKGFNWKRVPSEAQVNQLPGVLPTDGRTVIFTFDSYLKPGGAPAPLRG
jgi:hypothetical protein